MKRRFAVILLLTCNSVFAQTQTRVYEWEEVQGAHPDTIYGISFAKMKLSEFPPELAAFKQLRVLDAHKNKLTALPTFIDDFASLEVLDLSRNELAIFPIGICRMKSLQRLIINRNEFDQLPECIEYARNLKYIDLFGNPIRKLPESLMRLEHLEEIDFSGIRFSPAFQETWIGRLPDVKLVFDAPCDCMTD